MTDIPSVDQLLPHDDPMILIDRAISVEALSIHCQVDIGAHNLFFDTESQTVPAYVGIEFMAQSVAAWSGYHALENGTTPQSDSYSVLVATNHCVMNSPRSDLDIYAEQLMEDSGMAVFTARVEDQGELVAQCQLNVYVPTEQKLQEMKTRSPS